MRDPAAPNGIEIRAQIDEHEHGAAKSCRSRLSLRLAERQGWSARSRADHVRGCGGGVAGEGGGCGASERATCAQPTKLAAAHGLRARRTEARRRQGDLCRMPCRRTHSVRISGRPRVRGRCVAPPAKKKATAPGPPRREPTRAAIEPARIFDCSHSPRPENAIVNKLQHAPFPVK